MEIERPAQPRARRVPLRGGASIPNTRSGQRPVGNGPSAKSSKKALRDIPSAKKAPSTKKEKSKALRDIPQGAKSVQGTKATRPVPQNAPKTKVNFKTTKAQQSPRPTKPQRREQARAEINRKINTQTPSSRQQARVVKRVGGSAKNIEIKRRTNSSKQKFYVKKKRANLIRLLLARLLLFVVVFAVMFSAVAGLFVLSLHSGSGASGGSYILQLGKDKAKDDTSDYKPEILEISGGSARVDGNLYFPVSALMDYCSLTVTGTVDHLRYISRDSDLGSMSFVVGSNIAYVNNLKVRMESDSFISEGKLYIPLDFLIKYSKGIDITEDTSGDKVTIARVMTGYDAATDTEIYAPLSFVLAKTEPLTAIEEPIE